MWGEHCTVEANLWLPYPALAAAEYHVILHHSLHQLEKVPVMLLMDMAIDTHIILDGYDTRKTVNDVVHAHLEDILAHLQTEGHMKRLVPPLGGVGTFSGMSLSC